MNINNLINYEDITNIGINLSKINSELEDIKNTISNKCDTYESFQKLDNLQQMSSRFTYWDYNATHGFNNLLEKVDTISEIIKILDYNSKKKDNIIKDLHERIVLLEKTNLKNNI